ncbi:unnamed protein product [Clonostachys solani]|uniref:BTB domain-containing protein n=1 Tax=Clonostachys solani TaxID=160281 RepID=A0A9N9ZIH9_9HYPO|nr:unnamed protein product [Clonostachys solani]
MDSRSRASTATASGNSSKGASLEARRNIGNARRGAGKDVPKFDGTSIAISELQSSISRLSNSLFNSGLYSDLTVICGDDKYLVHKAVICPRSTFFEGACRHNFKEAITGEINLPADDPTAVKIMMNHFYNLNYSDGSATTSETDPALPGDKTSKFSLLVHAKVYSLAEKYGIASLKKLAVDKFERQARKELDGEDFLEAAVEAYTGTVQADRELRDEVVRTITLHMDVLKQESFREATSGLDIGVDVLVYLKEQGRIRSSDWANRW